MIPAVTVLLPSISDGEGGRGRGGRLKSRLSTSPNHIADCKWNSDLCGIRTMSKFGPVLYWDERSGAGSFWVPAQRFTRTITLTQSLPISCVTHSAKYDAACVPTLTC